MRNGEQIHSHWQTSSHMMAVYRMGFGCNRAAICQNENKESQIIGAITGSIGCVVTMSGVIHFSQLPP